MLFIVFVVMVVIAAVVGFWFLMQPKQPAGSVKFSISRSAIEAEGNATITVTVENFDMLTHSVEYRFNVSDRISIYEGAQNLLPRIGSQYTFNYTLEASDPSKTKVFLVIGRLEKGISSATYPISLSVYFDGKKLDKTWNDLILKVEQ